jgi:phage terminase small subunit
LDVMVLAAHCISVATWQGAVTMLTEAEACDPERKGLVIKTPSGADRINPVCRIADRAADLMVRSGAEFGMGALARQKLEAGMGGFPPPGPRFDGLIGRPDHRPGDDPA